MLLLAIVWIISVCITCYTIRETVGYITLDKMCVAAIFGPFGIAVLISERGNEIKLFQKKE